MNTGDMSALRPALPTPLHPGRDTVEQLIDRIAGLVLERQALRAIAAPHEELEQNRARLVSAHWELSHALIERHCPAKADAASAAA